MDSKFKIPSRLHSHKKTSDQRKKPQHSNCAYIHSSTNRQTNKITQKCSKSIRSARISWPHHTNQLCINREFPRPSLLRSNSPWHFHHLSLIWSPLSLSLASSLKPSRRTKFFTILCETDLHVAYHLPLTSIPGKPTYYHHFFSSFQRHTINRPLELVSRKSLARLNDKDPIFLSSFLLGTPLTKELTPNDQFFSRIFFSEHLWPIN